MDKKKMITASLASVAILGSGFVSQNQVVNADETATSTVMKDDIASLKAALTEVENAKISKINEDDTLSSSDKAKAIEDAKAEVGKDDVLKAIASGELSLDDVLNELPTEDSKIEKVEKTKELTKEDEAKIAKAEATEAAKSDSDKLQDKADDLSDKISKLEKRVSEYTKAIADKTSEVKAAKDEVSRLNDLLNSADENADENWISNLEKEKEDAEAKVAKLNDELAALVHEANPVVNYLNSLVDEYNATLKDLAATKAKDAESEDKAIEALQNKVADLEKEVAEIENQLNGIDSNVEDYYVEGLREKLDAKKAEFEKAQDELDKALDAISPEVSEKGKALVQPEAPEFTGGVNGTESAVNEVPEFGAHNPEIKNILNEIAEVRQNIEDGEANGAEPYMIEGLKSRLDDLLEALDVLVNNKPTTNEVPEFTGGVNDSEPTVNEVPTFDVASLTQQQQESTDAVPAATDEKQEVETELPNTGVASGTALTSVGIGALLLGMFSFMKRKKI